MPLGGANQVDRRRVVEPEPPGPLDELARRTLGLLLPGVALRRDERAGPAERGREAILGTATDAFISIDDLGAVLDWNAAAVRLFGFSAAEAVGRQLWSLIVPERSVERHRQGVARAGLGTPRHSSECLRNLPPCTRTAVSSSWS